MFLVYFRSDNEDSMKNERNRTKTKIEAQSWLWIPSLPSFSPSNDLISSSWQRQNVPTVKCFFAGNHGKLLATVQFTLWKFIKSLKLLPFVVLDLKFHRTKHNHTNMKFTLEIGYRSFFCCLPHVACLWHSLSEQCNYSHCCFVFISSIP